MWHCVELVSVEASVVSPGDGGDGGDGGNGGDGGEGAFLIALWSYLFIPIL